MLLRTVNTLGRALAWFGIEPGCFELEPMLDAARAATGLDDFGRDDFRRPLALLLDDIQSMGRELTTVARIGLERDLPRSERSSRPCPRCSRPTR